MNDLKLPDEFTLEKEEFKTNETPRNNAQWRVLIAEDNEFNSFTMQ